MLTVLQIIPNMGAGGAEQTCAPIAAALVQRGDRAILVTTGGAQCASFAEAGGEVILRNVKTKNPVKILKNALWLARLIKEQRVDVVHARSRAPAWSAYLACKKAGIPFVTTFHAAYKFKGGAKRAYNSVMAKGARVIAISRYIAEHIRLSYGISETLRIIPRGIDLAQLQPASVTEERRAALRTVWGIGADARVVFVPARLSPIKGQSTILEAMALLKTAPNVVTIIAGDPQGREAYRASLVDRVQALGLQDSVKIVPHCSDMAAAYSLASLVLVPSRVPEGFGRVPVEAMAMGVPVIASALGATTETVIEGKTGWLVPAEDPSAWAAAIERALALSAEEARRMALAARAHVEAHYAKEKMVAATLAVYDEVAGK